MLALKRATAVALLTVMVATGLWGLVKYPDAPIHRCGSAYCGKQGQPRTRADFEEYEALVYLRMGLVPLTLLAGFYWLPRQRENPYDKLNALVRSEFQRYRDG